MLASANPRLKAMILLVVNCGFGQADCATLPRSAVDLAGGWLTHPRAKTGTARRAKLWPETVAALEAVLALPRNPQRAEYAALVFLSADGLPIVRGSLDTVRPAFVAMLKRLDLQRPGRGFYGLRHSFATIAGGTGDQIAVNAIMGHTDSSMAANYRHGIDDSRLVAVAEHVHAWLWESSREGTK